MVTTTLTNLVTATGAPRRLDQACRWGPAIALIGLLHGNSQTLFHYGGGSLEKYEEMVESLGGNARSPLPVEEAIRSNLPMSVHAAAGLAVPGRDVGSGEPG